MERLGGRLVRNCEVTKIVTDQEKKRVLAVRAVGADGKERLYEGDVFLSSMPLKELAAGMGDTLPEAVRGIAAGLPYRDYVIIGLLIDERNWKGGFSDCWIYVQDTGEKLGRIQIYQNWSPYLLDPLGAGVWVGLEYFCTEGDDFWKLSEEESVFFAAKELIKLGLICKESDVIDAHRETVKKAYPAYFCTYAKIKELTA